MIKEDITSIANSGVYLRIREVQLLARHLFGHEAPPQAHYLL